MFVLGILYCFFFIFKIVGFLIVGWIYDIFDSYVVVFICVGGFVMVFICILLIVLLFRMNLFFKCKEFVYFVVCFECSNEENIVKEICL